MILLVIRHGQSEADLLDVHEGRADYPLTSLGIRQAEALADKIAKEYQVQSIYCSPLKRAYQTAEYLSQKTGICIQKEPLLMEFNNGLLAGMDRKTAAEKYPYIPDLPLHQAVYQQESKLDFRFRAEKVLSEILSKNPQNAVIAIVSHGGMINQLHHAFLGLPVGSKLIFCTGDTGVHEWRIENNKRQVVYINRLDHLA